MQQFVQFYNKLHFYELQKLDIPWILQTTEMPTHSKGSTKNFMQS